MSPVDNKFFELIIPIATFLTGTLSGIMLAGDDKDLRMKAIEAANKPPPPSAPTPSPSISPRPVGPSPMMPMAAAPAAGMGVVSAAGVGDLPAFGKPAIPNTPLDDTMNPLE